MSDIRVLVADDQALVRASFGLLVGQTPGLVCVGEAATGREAVTMARRERPAVVLMDVRMPEMNGIEATRLICAEPGDSRPRVLMLTTFDLDEYVFGALRAGASGFLLKEVLPTDLIAAIRVVAAGDGLLMPEHIGRLIAAYAATPEPRRPDLLAGLTDREREVLSLVAAGRSNEEIGGDLHLSMATVKSHIGRLLTKLDARDRAQLVIAAYEGGLR